MQQVGLAGGSVVKNLPAVQEPQETWVRSLGQEDLLERGMAYSLQYSCLENPMESLLFLAFKKS